MVVSLHQRVLHIWESACLHTLSHRSLTFVTFLDDSGRLQSFHLSPRALTSSTVTLVSWSAPLQPCAKGTQNAEPVKSWQVVVARVWNRPLPVTSVLY